MKRRILRNTDLSVSNICFGTGNFGEKLSKEAAFMCLDAFVAGGGNFIDTANVYCRWVPGLKNSSETLIGEWLRTRNAYDKVVIATKGGHYDFGRPELPRVNRTELEKDLDESLKTLGLEALDFYWLHRDDPTKDMEEIIEIMEGFVKAGKIRYYGASNYTKERVRTAAAYAEKMQYRGFCALSNQWSLAKVNQGNNPRADQTLVYTDDAYYEWHKETKMPLVPYSSSAQGFFQKLLLGSELSEGMKAAYLNEDNLIMFQKLLEEHEKTGASVYALSLAWLSRQPFMVFPIVSVSKPEQMKEILAAGKLCE